MSIYFLCVHRDILTIGTLLEKRCVGTYVREFHCTNIISFSLAEPISIFAIKGSALYKRPHSDGRSCFVKTFCVCAFSLVSL